MNVGLSVSINAHFNETKKFYLNLKNNPASMGYYEVQLTNNVGYTFIETPTFTFAKGEVIQGWFEKINKNGQKAISTIVKAPAGAQFMFFIAKSTETANNYDVLVGSI